MPATPDAAALPQHRLIVHRRFADFAGGELDGARWVADDRRLRLALGAAAGGGEGSFVSRELAPRAPFRELIPSWNVDVEPGAGFDFDLRVAGPDGRWSDWLHFGEWGDAPPACARRAAFDGGRVEVDVLRADRPLQRFQYRLRGRDAEVDSIALCLSAGTGGPHPSRPRRSAAPLDVPFRSQRWERPELAPRVCSPTAVAMVLEHRGVEVPTQRVAELAYDAHHDLYGNWSRAVQAAYSLGVPGYVARFDDWDAVAAALRAGQPLIASIAAGVGALSGAPFPSTEGHLVVLVGLDERGDPLVNDPAAPSAEAGRIAYDRDEFERAWMDRGGTAYVLLPPD